MKRLWTLAVVVLTLAGCASYDIKSTRLSNNAPLNEGHGVVAVQVVNNTGRLAPLHAGWTEVIAVRLDNRDAIEQAAIEAAKAKAKEKNKPFDPEKVDWSPEIYSFSPNPQGVIDSQLFAGSMPEGQYVVSSLYSFYTDGNVSSWITMPVWYSAGTFEVKAGRFTNLGTIVFQPLLSIKETSFWSSSSSQKAFVTRMEEVENLQDFIVGHYPNLANSIDFQQPLSWEEDELTEFRSKLTKLSRSNAYGSHNISIDEQGNRAVAAKFGQLHWLNADGQWQQVDLPTNGQVTSVVKLADKIMVGAERGQVFVADSMSGPWTMTQPVPPTEAIKWMGQSQGTVYAVTAAFKQHKVYQIDLNSGEWQELGSFVRKDPNDFFVQNGGLFPILTADGGLRILNDNMLHQFDPLTRSWSKVKSEALVDMIQMSNGTLLGLEVSQWDGVGDQTVSYDYGQTWVSLSRSLRTFGDYATDRSLPFYLDDGTLVTLGRADKRIRNLQIISTAADNEVKRDDWVSKGIANESCQVALPGLTRGQRIFFLCDQGQIVSTADFGQSWQTEVDMDIAQMQVEYDSFIAAMKAELELKKAAAEKQAEQATEQQPEATNQPE